MLKFSVIVDFLIFVVVLLFVLYILKLCYSVYYTFKIVYLPCLELNLIFVVTASISNNVFVSFYVALKSYVSERNI